MKLETPNKLILKKDSTLKSELVKIPKEEGSSQDILTVIRKKLLNENPANSRLVKTPRQHNRNKELLDIIRGKLLKEEDSWFKVNTGKELSDIPLTDEEIDKQVNKNKNDDKNRNISTKKDFTEKMLSAVQDEPSDLHEEIFNQVKSILHSVYFKD